ncbi:chromate transporter [Bacillus sonorensis]|uniref:Chromate transporter n=2 Tax=Bacillus sonorensis TaxID=119858 RepID=M5P1X4_9BACI|nr:MULTISPECIES: chromate transporter [Bacillus]TWK80615.1 putative chromate transport protein [Bacillus paralicheniformis]ASB87096.1 putative transporter YwrA [Bacillus sonorensis]EME73419.1 chromate transporter [Bacillus sonorensis L12]MBG9914399.1 transporter [Bacillus sonorensis]MCF7616347.1 chromate transporter [Bacillus sonorensis]
MILLYLFWAFFIANLLGYGGGPASIPLNFEEVVHHFHWLSKDEFSNMLALANALPGPIATKIASYVGYSVFGWPGAVVALIATTLPSAVVLILLLKLIRRFRKSQAIKGMTLAVQPVIAVMMLLLTWEIGGDAVHSIGFIQTSAIALVALVGLTKFRIHPAVIIAAAFAYGGIVIPLL